MSVNSTEKKTDMWMPIYIGDYLSDTTRLTTQQHGAYFLLMMDYWKSGPPPDDDVVLAQITKLTSDAWSIVRASLEHKFSIKNGRWIHNRIDKEIILAKKKSVDASAKAKVAANKRWGKDNKNASSNTKSNTKSNTQAMPEQCPSPSPSPLIKTNTLSQAPKFNFKDELKKLGVTDQHADDWLQVRKEKKAANTQTAFDAFLVEIKRSGKSVDDAVKIAAENGWKGFRAEWLQNIPASASDLGEWQ